MVEKMEKEGKMEQEQETLLYLMILELRSDWAGGLAVLDNPLGKKLEAGTSYVSLCQTKRLEFHQKLGNWEDVSRLARNLLLDSPDQWVVYQSYITAVLLLEPEGQANGEEDYSMERNKVDRSAKEALRLLRSLQELHPKLRGPHLAELELVSRLTAARQLHLLPQPPPSLPELLTKYYKKFGGKNVCFSDMKLYIPSVEQVDIGALLNR